MSKEPLFLALGDDSIRLDPRKTPTGYLKLTLTQAPETNDNGLTVREGRASAIWLTESQAKELADLLYAEASLSLVDKS